MNNTWSDFDINLNTQNNGDIKKDIDVNAIQNSLSNICTTLKGSRRMLPNFATNLQYLLFEPISKSTAYLIANELISCINYWDNRVKLEGIDIIPDYDNNKYNCKIKYKIINNPTIEYNYAFVLRQE